MGMYSAFAEASGLGASRYVNEADLAEEMDRLEAMPAAEMEGDIEDMYVEAMVANEKNLNTIMMSVVAEEYQYLVENGTELIYEGARLDAFFEKVKSLLDKAWQKIKSIFEKALNNVKAWTATDAKFVQKYGDKIKAANGEICKISDTFKINLAELKSDPYSELANRIRATVNNYGKGADEASDKMVDGVLYGTTGSREEKIKEFKNKLGMGEKTVDIIKGSAVVEELREGKTTKNNIKIHYNDAKKCIAGIKKSVDDAKKEASKNKTVDDSVGSYSRLLTLCNKAVSLINGYQSLQLQAAKVYHSNCRTIARRVVSGKTYKETNEAGGIGGDFANLLA